MNVLDLKMKLSDLTGIPFCNDKKYLNQKRQKRISRAVGIKRLPIAEQLTLKMKEIADAYLRASSTGEQQDVDLSDGKMMIFYPDDEAYKHRIIRVWIK